MPKALVVFACGARGTGKTAWMVRQAAKDRRMVWWDFKHDANLDGIGADHTDLPAMIRAMAAPSFRLRYLVDHDRDVHAQFELFCRAAWMAGRLEMNVSELPEVTKANRAPPIWRKCVNVGRDYEGGKWIGIRAEAQRLAEVDKSFIGNCDVVHTGRLGNIADCEALARMWGCAVNELATMPDLHWIERRADRPGLQRGVLSFAPGAKKVSAPRAALRKGS